MSMHLRMNHTFVEDETWHEKYDAYQGFLKQAIRQNPVFLELGVGFNTPTIIRFPFEQMTSANPNATPIRINQENAGPYYRNLSNIISIQQDLKGAIEELKHYSTT